MVNPKVLELLRKYSDERDPTGFVNVNTPNTANQEKLENYGHELHMKFRAVLAELEHDASLLKMRNFDPEMLKLLVGIWRHLEKLFVGMNQEQPLKTAHQIVQILNDRHTKAVIDNLIFLAEHHVKSTNVNYTPSKFLRNPELRGLKLLLELKKTAENAPGSIAPVVAPEVIRQTVQETWRPPSSQSMQAVEIPKLPPLRNVTPIPAPMLVNQPESPDAKRNQQEQGI
jgi:hypothetical protein